MNRLKSFFTGILLLAIVFAMVVLTALIYRAQERSYVKSYIFQMSNYASQRVGTLQNLNNISANDLRNKLIKAYVSEYFKVIPGDKNITNRSVLKNLSFPEAFDHWKETEAKTIDEMSSKNMFRIVRVHDDGIATYNKLDNTSKGTESVYYMVRYYTSTWTESNRLETEPVYDQGTLYLEILFEPGLAPYTIDGEKIDVRKHLESGGNPVELFKFRVTKVK